MTKELSENECRPITAEDMDKVVQEAANREDPIAECCSCGKKDLARFMVYGFQCENCWSLRIPIFGSSPLSHAYWREL